MLLILFPNLKLRPESLEFIQVLIFVAIKKIFMKEPLMCNDQHLLCKNLMSNPIIFILVLGPKTLVMEFSYS